MSDIIELSAWRAARVLPPENVEPAELPPGLAARIAAVDRGEDLVFHDIARHQAAIEAHEAAVNAECTAEETGLDAEQLRRQTSKAFDHMVLMGRILVISCARSRRGLIALAKHFEQQFDMVADTGGCSSMPDTINERHWCQVLFQSLALQLRKMGDELPKGKRRRRSQKPQP